MSQNFKIIEEFVQITIRKKVVILCFLMLATIYNCSLFVCLLVLHWPPAVCREAHISHIPPEWDWKLWVLTVKLMTKLLSNTLGKKLSATLDIYILDTWTLQSTPNFCSVAYSNQEDIHVSHLCLEFFFALQSSPLLYSLQLPSQGLEVSLLCLTKASADISVLILPLAFQPKSTTSPWPCRLGRVRWILFVPNLCYMSRVYVCPCPAWAQPGPHYRQLSLEGHTSPI